MPLSPLPPSRGLWVSIIRIPKGLIAMFVTSSLLLVCNILQMLSAPLLLISRRAVRIINRAIGGAWWGLCDRMAVIWGIEIEISGDDLPMRENVMVIANHQAMTDINTLFRLARRQGRIGDLKWFVKDAIKYVPGIGWGMIFLDCIFLKRDWKRDKERLFHQLSRFEREQIPVWTLSFVEGTRLRPHKLQASIEYAHSKGWIAHQHLLLPRTKGFCLTLEAMNEHLDAVYDATIGYVDGVPTLWQWCRGDVRRVELHVRRFSISEIPKEEEALSAWLRERWVEKDALLNHYYQHGAWPSEHQTLG